ncbi:MAG: acyltransferase [Tepidanaerobacteraceae bacterium]|jgi:acetyltransferase-like isoleucine patch superfamily enzyme|nr:acyltransferase [Tepidanaerobacter sp.]HQA60619.1 acyltransferase [Tepidanaerobacteraceae bacterium]HQE05528.1 acyltransferase [Tepidanaerobacteraceae bacterium]
MRRVQRHQVKEVNSLWYWYKTVNPFKVVINFIVIYFARFIPHLPLKNFLYRLIGMKVGKNVSVGLMAMFDIFFPELIEIGDNSIIGYNSTILAHEYMVKEWGTGKVVIGRNVTIGANVTVLPGVVIGDGTTVSACSLVNKDVPENAFVGGIPIKALDIKN